MNKDNEIKSMLQERYVYEYLTYESDWLNDWPVFVKLLGLRDGKLTNLYIEFERAVFANADFKDSVISQINSAARKHCVDISIITRVC